MINHDFDTVNVDAPQLGHPGFAPELGLPSVRLPSVSLLFPPCDNVGSSGFSSFVPSVSNPG